MNFVIRERETQKDVDNFLRSSFETAKNLNDYIYTNLKNANPNKNDNEIFELFKVEIVDSFDFERPDCKIFMMDGENGQFAGYIWVAIRDSKDSWDPEMPLWIYDISVQPQLRRRGLGRRLLQKAEAFAKGLDLNIGLFVHAQNIGAVNLYKTSDYKIKCMPVSKNPEFREVPRDSNEVRIREETPEDKDMIHTLGFEKFRRLIRYSSDVSGEEALDMYQEVQKCFNDNGKHVRYTTINESGDVIGFIWVGEAFFNDKVAMIYDFAVHNNYRQKNLVKPLFVSAENWVKSREFNRFYLLLHADDDITLETCHELGLKESGYFMEKRLK